MRWELNGFPLSGLPKGLCLRHGGALAAIRSRRLLMATPGAVHPYGVEWHIGFKIRVALMVGIESLGNGSGLGIPLDGKWFFLGASTILGPQVFVLA